MTKNMQTNSRVTKKRVKKKRRKKRLLLTVVFSLLILFLIGGGWVFKIFNQVNQAVENSFESDGREAGSELREFEVNPSKDNVSVLFIGVDHSEHRANENYALSDALILATLNIEENSVKLLSIPRDSLVYIPAATEPGYRGSEMDKITHAHAYGGPRATIDAIEHLLEVPVDYFVRMNFHAFVDVVDALGGIQFDVPYEFRESDSDDRGKAIHLLPGVQNINGEEALALARTRYKDNDIQRGKRQQELMEAILKKTVSIGSISRISSVIDAVEDNIMQNIGDDMLGFASYAISGDLDLEMVNLEGTDLWTDLYYYQINDESLREVQQTLQLHLGIIDEEDVVDFNVAEEDETGDQGAY